MLDRTKKGLHRLASRRYRQRVKAHGMCVWVEVDDCTLSWLVDAPRWLSREQADAGDRKVIGAAISAGLKRSAKAAKEPDER